MKQGSLTSFINLKSDKTASQDKKKNAKNIDNTIPIPSPLAQDDEKMKIKSSVKRRHILDEDEEEAQKEITQAEDLLLPTESKTITENKKQEIPEKQYPHPNEVISNVTIKTSSTPAKNNIIIKSPEDDTNNSISFMTLVNTLSQIETLKGENSKDAIKELFAILFKDIILTCPSDLPKAYYFLLSKVGPEYKSPELGIGPGTLEKVVGKVTGKSDKQIKDKMIELGDLALVAMEGKKTLGTMDKFHGFVKTGPKKELTLKQVMDTFTEMANMKGKSSLDEKQKLLTKIMFLANKDELKFLVRSLQKSLKIGASFKTIIAALARAVAKIFKEHTGNLPNEKEIEKAILVSINQLTDEDLVLSHLIKVITEKHKIEILVDLCGITPGIPLNPQLARPTNGIKVIFERFEGVPFTCEYKYDGFRGQIHHYPHGISFKTEVFSRNLENMTETYPDIVDYVKKIHNDKACSFIIDCEIVAFDTKSGKILPFQQLTTRARKNVNVSEITIQVCMFVFDIIYINGQSLCGMTLDERRKILKENFEESEHVQFAKSIISDKLEEVEEFMNEAKSAGCEGLIIKALFKNSQYMPGERNFNWLKLKKDYLETSIGDSIELVPIGAQYGKGKRKGFYGSYLLACYNEDNETYETVTMTGAGLKDEDLENMYKELNNYLIEKPREDYRIGDAEVDVFFDAKMVWEIKTADLTVSPVYTAANGLTGENKGISLRFPRFIRVRVDKKPEECTSSEEIYKLYKSQPVTSIPMNAEDDLEE